MRHSANLRCDRTSEAHYVQSNPTGCLPRTAQIVKGKGNLATIAAKCHTYPFNKSVATCKDATNDSDGASS